MTVYPACVQIWTEIHPRHPTVYCGLVLADFPDMAPTTCHKIAINVYMYRHLWINPVFWVRAHQAWRKLVSLTRFRVKGETRIRGLLLQKVCAGFTCMALYLSKAWSHNFARTRVYLATWLWYTGTVTTNRSLFKMLWKSSKRQQTWRCAKPNVNQRIYYWGPQQLICMTSWGSKSNRKRKWKVGICTCSNSKWPN